MCKFVVSHSVYRPNRLTPKSCYIYVDISPLGRDRTEREGTGRGGPGEGGAGRAGRGGAERDGTGLQHKRRRDNPEITHSREESSFKDEGTTILPKPLFRVLARWL